MIKLKNKYLQTINWRGLAAYKKALYITYTAGIILLLFVLLFLFFPQTYLNGFLKSRINDAFSKAYPEYSLNIANVNFNFFKNRIECNSILLTKRDSTFSCGIKALSLEGVGWIELFRENKSSYSGITKTVLDIEGIVVDFKSSQNQIRCSRMHLSVPDSEFVADSLEYHPTITDEQFFAESKFRNTRYRLIVPKISINGLSYSGLILGNNYRARVINIRDAFIDILVNMDKPFDIKSPSPLMPNELLFRIKDTIRVDNLQAMNCRLNYYERSVVRAKAALITFDKAQVLIKGIVNNTGRQDTIVLNAQGNFMNTGTMKLFMLIPTEPQQLSFNYSGSLSKMEVSDLNKFLEISEHHRIKSGLLHTATYNIKVNSGYATGSVHAEYSDLSIAALNKNTASENGVMDRISSLVMKTFIIRGNNMPDKSGSMKIGVVKYTRKSDETFTQFVWFALRSGVGNVVGF